MKRSSQQTTIEISGLSKKYSGAPNYALKDLCISVKKSEVYGFLGPNGAGKSTAIRLLMDFIKPTGGSAKILGLDTIEQSVEIKKQVGDLSGDILMYPKMTGQQYLDYLGELQPPESKAYVKELSKRFKADLNKKLGALSRGNKQKIAIIQAFMHQPEILILDEPTSGLDPLMQEEFYKLVKESKERGSTVFVSSHILSEVQKMCDRIGIIKEGRLITEKNISELAKEAAQTFDIVFVSKPPVAELKKVKGVKVVEINDKKITIHVHGKLAPLFAVLAKQDVTEVDARNLDLEEVFLKFYQDKGAKR
jgi:ABC-2 type transport system ATP-binding protein